MDRREHLDRLDLDDHQILDDPVRPESDVDPNRLFQHLIDGFHNRDLRHLVADLPGVAINEYTGAEMTYDLRRLRLKGLIFRPPRTHRHFVARHGWKVARLFSRLEARVFRPAVAMFTGNDAVLPFPLRASLDRVDAQLDDLIYEAFPQIEAA